MGLGPSVRDLGAPFFVGAMGDEDEIHLHVTYAGHVDMDEAFCARLRNAIEAGHAPGLEPKIPNTSEQGPGRPGPLKLR